MKMTKTRAWLLCSLAAFALMGMAFSPGEPPADEVNRKPSTYAPAKDLEWQVDYFFERLKEDLADKNDYTETRAKRVAKDANTIAVLALVLGKHDDDNRYKKSAAPLLSAAVQLGKKWQDYDEAVKAYAELIRAAETSGGNSQLEWRSVGNIAEIMLQVPLLNTSLRGSVKGDEKFDRARDKAAGLSATIAAIAQVSMFDDTYCGDEADKAEWVELCALMRDTASEINQAVHRGDQRSAEDGLRPLKRTCDDCHDQFKD